MHTKSKYPFLRHIDFMVIDLLSLLLALSAAFPIKFHGVWFVSGVGWENYVWGRLISLMLAADIVLTLLLNPYSGIFKRKYYMEAISALRLVGFNAIAVALVLYIFKVGFIYSRTVFILTYVFYFFLSLIMKYIWKKLIVSGTIGLYNSKNVPLFNSDQSFLVKILSELFLDGLKLFFYVSLLHPRFPGDAGNGPGIEVPFYEQHFPFLGKR